MGGGGINNNLKGFTVLSSQLVKSLCIMCVYILVITDNIEIAR